jgi:hypothetical protein
VKNVRVLTSGASIAGPAAAFCLARILYDPAKNITLEDYSERFNWEAQPASPIRRRPGGR